MPTTTPSPAADRLRQRATTLTNLARNIARSGAMSLAALADETTWVGPSPQRCYGDLRTFQTVLQTHGDDLRATARRLLRQADEIEAHAQLVPVRV